MGLYGSLEDLLLKRGATVKYSSRTLHFSFLFFPNIKSEKLNGG